MSVRTRAAVLLTATTLLLAGCGAPNVSSILEAAHKNTSARAALPTAGSTEGGGSGGSGSGGAGFAFNSDCLAVASAYASIAMALLPSLTGGAGTYDAGQVTSAIAGLGGDVPTALKPDFQTLNAAAKAAAGKSMQEAGSILGTDAVTAASDHISSWMDKNCGS